MKGRCPRDACHLELDAAHHTNPIKLETLEKITWSIDNEDKLNNEKLKHNCITKLHTRAYFALLIENLLNIFTKCISEDHLVNGLKVNILTTLLIKSFILLARTQLIVSGTKAFGKSFLFLSTVLIPWFFLGCLSSVADSMGHKLRLNAVFRYLCELCSSVSFGGQSICVSVS